MQKLITNQPKNNNPIKQLQKTNRIYSFSQTNHIQNEYYYNQPTLVADFINDVNMIQQIHNVIPNIGNIFMINCNDVVTIQQAISDSTLAKQIRDRMNKYIKVVDYVSYGNIQEILPTFITNKQEQQYKHNASIINNIQQKTQKQKQSINQIQTNNIQKQHIEKNNFPSYMQPTLLSTSRYEKNQVKLALHKDKISIQNRNSKDRNLLNSKSPKNSNKGRLSNVNSRLNTSRNQRNNSNSQSKHFHLIQLKSVTKIKTSDPQQYSSQYQDTEQQKKQKITKKQTKNNRCTISQRNNQKPRKNTKDINNINNLHKFQQKNMESRLINKQSSRVTSLQKSRFSANTFSKSRKFITSHNDKNQQSLSPNRHLQRCCYGNVSRVRQKQLNKQKDNINQNKNENNNQVNLAYQTVQKSTDFLLMLRMMSQQ